MCEELRSIRGENLGINSMKELILRECALKLGLHVRLYREFDGGRQYVYLTNRDLKDMVPGGYLELFCGAVRVNSKEMDLIKDKHPVFQEVKATRLKACSVVLDILNSKDWWLELTNDNTWKLCGQAANSSSAVEGDIFGAKENPNAEIMNPKLRPSQSKKKKQKPKGKMSLSERHCRRKLALVTNWIEPFDNLSFEGRVQFLKRATYEIKNAVKAHAINHPDYLHGPECETSAWLENVKRLNFAELAMTVEHYLPPRGNSEMRDSLYTICIGRPDTFNVHGKLCYVM